MKKGTVFRFTAERYSSYEIIEWVQALRDFNNKNLLSRFLELNPEEAEEYHARGFDKFVTWVVTEGYVEIIPDPGKEWHLGEYGTYDRSCPS